MHSSINVAEELHSLKDTLQGALAALAEQKPQIAGQLDELYSGLVRVCGGNAVVGNVLSDAIFFLATLEAGKENESETFRNALRHAQDKVRATVTALLNTTMVA
jgi:hypothetical protein